MQSFAPSPANSSSSSASASISSPTSSPQPESSRDDEQPYREENFNVALNNSYEYLSTFDNDSFASDSEKSDNTHREPSSDTLKNLSDKIRTEIEKLVAKSLGGSRETKILDHNFINDLFDVFYRANFKAENFREIKSELVQSNVIRSQQFLALAKLGHECFKLGLLSTAECMLEIALNRIDTQSDRLKMATLSTLSACYWRQCKYINAIDCMHDELDLATRLGSQLAAASSTKNPYAYNRYRIYGNLASANQRLRNFDQCLTNLNYQLDLALNELNDVEMAVNALNSIGVLNQRLGDVEKSREYFLKSLDLIERASATSETDLRDLEVRQLNILGDFCMKKADFDTAREYFIRQLWLSADIKSYLSEAQALLNLGYLSSKLKCDENSVSYFERCLLSLNTNFDMDNIELSVVEMYAKCFIGLVNSYLSQKDTLNASLYAHSMLDFTLKQMASTRDVESRPKLDRYLKYMEINACSKLAVCYSRQNRPNDAIKLHEREILLAQELNNIMYLTRAYSHLAHIYHSLKNYQEAINYYKLILAKIESSLSSRPSGQIRDERLIEMIFYTLANIGYCLEGMGKHYEARLMFEEQFEIAKLMPTNAQKGTKSRATALLNLVNLTVGHNLDIGYEEVMVYLKSLLLVYEQLGDLNGQLFATQCMAYTCHKQGDLNQATQLYSKNIELATKLGKNDFLIRSLFNASLCYKGLGQFQTAFKLQSDYYSLVQKDPKSSVLTKFVSLGLIAELSFEMDSSKENCQRCLEIHIDRLNLIKMLESNSEILNKKFNLIYDCIESIIRLYTKLEDHQQVIKFKQLQLDLLSEENSPNENTVKQKKFKLWLELGGSYLSLNDTNQDEASKYFELVLEEAVKENDLLLESLAVGNLGLCRQKEGNYIEAIDFFKRQKTVLQQKLAQLEKTTASENKHQEVIPIRIDLARTNAKLAKCFQSVGNSSRAESHFKEYASECERLHKEYSKLQSDSALNIQINELKEQVFVDYDTSLAELGQFYSDSDKFDSAIDLNETRLKLMDMNFGDAGKRRNIKLQAFFNLAKLFAKKQKFQKPLNWEKSVEFCERLIESLDDTTNRELLVEALLLRFDLVYDSNPNLAISSSSEAYKTALLLDKFKLKSLKLKHSAMSRQVFSCRTQSRFKDCLETLMSSLGQVTAEFQEFEADSGLKDSDLACQYVEQLFLIHRRIALIHMEHSRDSRAHLLSLKHANEALVYLNHQRQYYQNDPKLVEFRLASVYYVLGLCHRHLGNQEMELDMFASSLDYYENLVQSGIDLDRDTLIRDKLIEEGGSFGSINYEEDEETVIKYSERVNKLYQFISDVLIRLNKLKEALLVVERYRSKLCYSSLGKLPDILNFEQIETLIDDDRFNTVIYFYYNELSSCLNCWLLKPQVGIARFERVEDVDKKLFEFEKTNTYETTRIELENLYDVLIKPVETEFEPESQKSMIWVVYDERMFKLPFHLMKPKDSDKFLYLRFEVNCVYSLKHLRKSAYNNQIFTRKRVTESGATFLPMKVVSSEEEMKKLMERFTRSQPNKQSEQFDLLLLLVNPEHKDVKSLNGLVNTLLSCKITKSVLVEFTYMSEKKVRKQNLVEFEKRANSFLKRLYSIMVNRTILNSSLIFNTLLNESTPNRENNLINFRLFGSLGLNSLKRIVKSTESKPPTQKDDCLDDVLFELTVTDSSEVTFSQVINQYLSLSTRIDDLGQVLSLVTGILQEYLNGQLGSEGISLKQLFEDRLTDIKTQYMVISAARLMLKRLGFSYYLDNSGKCQVKLPQIGLEKKLTLILRCLLTFEDFSPKLIKELLELSKKPHGKELLVLMKQHQTSIQTKEVKTTLILKEDTFKTNESFLREFAHLKKFSKNEGKVELEADSQTFNSLVLVTTILLSDILVKEAEKSLENYVEVFFKEVDNEKNLVKGEESLPLSSILRIEEFKPANASSEERTLKINVQTSPEFVELKIHKEEPNVKKALGKNVRFRLYDDRIYNNQIYELVETYFENSVGCGKRSNEKSECRGLLKMEEKEYMNQIVTTTTVETLRTNEELFKLFDNFIYDVYESAPSQSFIPIK